MKKSLCTWWLQYRKLHVKFKVPPPSLKTFIDTPNCVLEDSVQYSTVKIPNVFCDGRLQLINYVYCNRQVHTELLITLYITCTCMYVYMCIYTYIYRDFVGESEWIRTNERTRFIWEDNINIDIKRTGYGQVNVISFSLRCLAYRDYMKEYNFWKSMVHGVSYLISKLVSRRKLRPTFSRWNSIFLPDRMALYFRISCSSVSEKLSFVKFCLQCDLQIVYH